MRKRFADSGVTLWGLGTTCEYQSGDQAVVASNIDETKRWCQLAEDIGAHGVKVRPNGLPKDVPVGELAAWTATARVIFNLHEFITRN